jgi:hypothetical protein
MTGYGPFSQLRPVCRKSGLPRHAQKGNSLFPIYFLEFRFPGKTMTSLPESPATPCATLGTLRLPKSLPPLAHPLPPLAHPLPTDLRPARLLEFSRGLLLLLLLEVFPAGFFNTYLQMILLTD